MMRLVMMPMAMTGGMALAVLLTAASYAVLTGYEQLAFTFAGVRVSRWKIALVSFIGYAVANSVGFGLLSGSAVRYRFYARWNLTPKQMSCIVAFSSGTFWLGLLVLGGASLLSMDAPALSTMASPAWAGWARPLGVSLLLTASLYACAAIVSRGRLHVGRWAVPLPGWRVVLAQYALSILDWTLSAMVCWALLPEPRPPVADVAGLFAVAQVVGLISHVPGGLGAFETVMVLGLRQAAPMSAVLMALAAFRAIYYGIPLVIALVLLAVSEWLPLRDANRERDSGRGHVAAGNGP